MKDDPPSPGNPPGGQAALWPEGPSDPPAPGTLQAAPWPGKGGAQKRKILEGGGEKKTPATKKKKIA